MDPQVTIADCGQESIVNHRCSPEPAENLAVENQRLRFQLAHEVERRRQVEEERDLLQKWLWESQEINALGQAPEDFLQEFNEILTVILGFGDLLRSHLAPDPEALKMTAEIVAAGNQGCQLADRLLSAAKSMPRVEQWLCERR
jgi:two-component system, cell cycle sensor histidine kinase and response regulator CckA